MAQILMNKQQKTKVPENKPTPVPDKPNPQHKEDFDGLLDMAITPPKKPRT